MSDNELSLRYGANPHQKPARVFTRDRTLPIRVRNGAPGYINLLDALNAWQLVRELKAVLELPAAASFKHVSPAGAAVALPLSDVATRAYFVENMNLSPLATAYARARGADRLCSYGDWVALSDEVDLPTARLISREVSDGLIAPGFHPEALELLSRKQDGRYTMLEIDADFQPDEFETREVFGITFEQKRNLVVPDRSLLQNVVTKRKNLPEDAQRDLVVAMIALKYTQSNSVIFAAEGQVIGVGAGQQSRVHCVRLAGGKADLWYLRRHPAVLALPFREGIRRPERDNAIDLFLAEDLSAAEERGWLESFRTAPRRLTPAEKREWLAGLKGVSLGSDAFFPFRDSIDRASRSGVEYVVQPGGAMREQDIISACDEYNMVMALSGVRLFHH